MRLPLALSLALSALSPLTLLAQNASDTPEAHIAAAKAAAGDDFQNLFEFQCNGPGPRKPRRRGGAGRAGQARHEVVVDGRRDHRTDRRGTTNR